MDRDTASEWASRIGNERLTKDDIYWVFSFVGEELDPEFMVVSRRSMFREFKEGEQEKLARKLLEEEGLRHFGVCNPSKWKITVFTISPKERILSTQDYVLARGHPFSSTTRKF
ncbi:uncharacterized protein EV420DRAFT_1639678 [Desarmillaria tabescens]|uniref:Uncharacterized protein n=1 Tax=Armillaria tabescens TaxID=1929756 RepID=A0AA39NBG7_ARMTA|nr:uncharacterized protein EV420DRAFT_1639678 [Desarmillaria tabescens]KAK0462458.1 hypothetical protein EV420DRAFT_1639678 [Desarmillaria tabescens]